MYLFGRRETCFKYRRSRRYSNRGKIEGVHFHRLTSWTVVRASSQHELIVPIIRAEASIESSLYGGLYLIQSNVKTVYRETYVCAYFKFSNMHKRF